MTGIRVRGNIAGSLQKLHMYLKGCVGQFAQKLSLRNNFGRHKIQDQYIQRTDILVHGTKFSHNKNIFGFQRGMGRQGIRDANRHGISSL